MKSYREPKHTKEDLKRMQSLPFEVKIGITQTRILEWYQRFDGNVFVSFSGGKDSTVLLDLARRCFPNIEAVFVDTGLEFPEVRDFTLSKDNVTVLKPKLCKICSNCSEGCYQKVLKKYGWCYPSKDVAHTIYYARKGSPWALHRLMGTDENGEPSKYRQSHYLKWAFLKNSPFIISSKCCEVMKEKPLNEYRKQCGKRPIIGTMASESKRRLEAWLQTGCNAFDSKKQVSKPLSFWTEQDVLRYLRDFNISYASVYGDIITDKNGKLCTTGENRTGCIFCPVGCHLDKENRFQRLKSTHPELYDYCINVLGLGAFLDYIGVNYS